MDWKETHDSHIFELDLPGFTKDDVKLELHENRVLCIKAEKKTEQEEENEEMNLKWHCRERRKNGLFLREFRLPENSKVDDVKASMHEGVLTIIVAKDKTKKKNMHQQKKKVKIYEEGGDDEGVFHKGIGRFVCCKA
ncbi:18.1 kDa class I heat shock protein [Trifolium repens]|jgi:HSP20 family protein|nr:18.1 kDa class I heat shock protein [Trifolium repens]